MPAVPFQLASAAAGAHPHYSGVSTRGLGVHARSSPHYLLKHACKSIPTVSIRPPTRNPLYVVSEEMTGPITENTCNRLSARGTEQSDKWITGA
ncbi:hypothetical protein EYF80_042241 [Liparis tanakae]|uniref:Uncharacterized protein n=1 Tax=Liparis tanakae TaxID=230148 RepID=A0A4Z2G1Z5_9TELE|nr:hypothetical protein EYF80_042241 [Liparis tanakae]